MEIRNLYLKVSVEDVFIGEAFNLSFGKMDLFFDRVVGWGWFCCGGFFFVWFFMSPALKVILNP